jgi:hypothetical protein
MSVQNTGKVTCTVKKGHARNFSSELIHILLLNISKDSNIS